MTALKDEEMFISVKKLKEKLDDVKAENKEEMKKVQETAINIINSEKEKYRKTVNSMKGSFDSSKALYINTSPFGHKKLHQVGVKTGLCAEGFEIYTGDEIRLDEGGLGVVCMTDTGTVYVQTNMFRHEITQSDTYAKRFNKNSHNDIDVTQIEITKHFNELIEGDEIAKGRRGGQGFKVIKTQEG